MKTLWIAGAVSVLSFASVPLHAKSVCDIHHLGYTKAQCDQCSNMRWSVTRVTPKGECVATTPPQPITIGGANKGTLPPAPVPAKTVCDIHHLGYTKAQCDQCSNMRWSVSTVFPKGECVSTTPPQPITIGGTHGMPPPPPAGSSCTLTNWGGATIPLKSPNFSGTGVPVSVCAKGYDLAKSQFQCSTGVPARAFNYPNTNVTCNKTTAVGGNPQVTINGRPCCIN
ncbi:MAG TPA: hypothetical protein VEG27_02180 [Usitatibacter sp.]|nr:hypothetical protein [Usitatibacter sp.]